MPVDREQQRTYASRDIAAPAEDVFAVLTDPSLHPVIDGSGSVKRVRGNPEKLEMGSKFTMSMRIGIPYIISSKVVEYDEDRVIAWCHLGKHRWRFELEPTGEASTRVTESFDWSTAISPGFLERVGYPDRHEAHIEQTLERLDAYLTNRSAAL